jgi:hypothetical protein
VLAYRGLGNIGTTEETRGEADRDFTGYFGPVLKTSTTRPEDVVVSWYEEKDLVGRG